MSIMDLFKTSQPEVQAPTTPPVSPATEASKLASTPVNPVDAYANLYDTTKTQEQEAAPSFRLDSTALSEVSSKMDFTKGIAPDLMQKATSGDVNALLQVIQTVGQQAYKASVDHTTSLTDSFLSQRQSFEDKRVNEGVKSQLTQQELQLAPNYNHPVVKTELNRIAAQVAKANPDYSPQQVAQTAQQYIKDLSQALHPEATKQQQASGTGTNDMDWSKYLQAD